MYTTNSLTTDQTILGWVSPLAPLSLSCLALSSSSWISLSVFVIFRCLLGLLRCCAVSVSLRSSIACCLPATTIHARCHVTFPAFDCSIVSYIYWRSILFFTNDKTMNYPCIHMELILRINPPLLSFLLRRTLGLSLFVCHDGRAAKIQLLTWVVQKPSF